MPRAGHRCAGRAGRRPRLRLHDVRGGRDAQPPQSGARLHAAARRLRRRPLPARRALGSPLRRPLRAVRARRVRDVPRDALLGHARRRRGARRRTRPDARSRARAALPLPAAVQRRVCDRPGRGVAVPVGRARASRPARHQRPRLRARSREPARADERDGAAAVAAARPRPAARQQQPDRAGRLRRARCCRRSRASRSGSAAASRSRACSRSGSRSRPCARSARGSSWPAHRTWVELPWTLVDDLPLASHALPARAFVLVWLALAVLVALFLARGGRARWIVFGLVAATLAPSLDGSLWVTRLDRPALFQQDRWRAARAPGRERDDHPVQLRREGDAVAAAGGLRLPHDRRLRQRDVPGGALEEPDRARDLRRAAAAVPGARVPRVRARPAGRRRSAAPRLARSVGGRAARGLRAAARCREACSPGGYAAPGRAR